MNTLYLSRDAYVCEYEDTSIFLLLRTGRYLALGSDTLDQLSGHIYGWKRTADAEVTPPDIQLEGLPQQLVELGILTTRPEQGQAVARSFVPAACSLLDEIPSLYCTHISLRDVRHFVLALISVRLRLRAGGLIGLVKLQQKARSQHTATNECPAIDSAVSAFLRIRPWFYTAKDACLTDSLILLQYLRRHGIGATLVIGVRAKPFRAHAWVQIQNRVLNDTTEAVSDLVPILTE